MNPIADRIARDEDQRRERQRLAARLPRETQTTIGEWGRETFPNFKGARNRVVAVLEEAVELAITEGLSREEILRTVGVPLDKQEARGEAGDSGEEAADVDITLRAYAYEKGFDLHGATDKKMGINRLRPRDHYLKKTQAKVDMGLPKYEIATTSCPSNCLCHKEGAISCGTKTNMYHEPCCGAA